MILVVAREHAVVARELEDRLSIQQPLDQIVADISVSIGLATDFDRRLMNHNFEVDWQSYAKVQKGLTMLVELGRLDEAKSLAIQLMKSGSYQVECSDEGLMCDDICGCLKPVIQAVKAAGGVAVAQWAAEMQKADRVGYLCDQELKRRRGVS